jgi:sugar/nucleoside kinase (ribokinase family)
MSYERLEARLASGLDCRHIVTLPDGSVDRYYAVRDATGTRIPTRDAFVELLSSARVRSLQLSPEEIRAGGQAVNTARQVHALDQSVELYGHLDDPALGPFPFRTVSMGAPATVHVLAFDESGLMLSVESTDIADWDLAVLFAVADVDPDHWLDDEVLVVQNWVGFPAMTEALRQLATVDLGDVTLVFDPGDVTGTPADAVEALCGALETLADTVGVVLSANDRELDRLVTVLDAGDDVSRERAIRDALGLEAVVFHHESHAAVAADERWRVENFTARRVDRRTGAGDRFDGGLAVGIAADLPWEETLALGNACATYYVENDAIASVADIRDLVDSRPVDE